VIRLIIVVTLLVGLIGLATFEQIFIARSFNTLRDGAIELIAVINQPENESPVDTKSNKEKIDTMYDFWIRRERNLAMLARHADLAQISDAIIYARNFIYFDIREEAAAGLTRLIYLIDTHSFNIGTSFQNII